MNTDHFDVLHVGDLRCTGDRLWRLVNECLIEASCGLQVGLVHREILGESSRVTIHPEIEALLATGIAVGIEGDAMASAHLLTVHMPELLDPALAAVTAKQTVCIVEEITEGMSYGNCKLSGILFQGINSFIHEALCKIGLPVAIEPRTRSVAIRKLAGRNREKPIDGQIVPSFDGCDETLLWCDSESAPAAPHRFAADEICYHRFLTHINRLTAPRDSYCALMAMAHGVAAVTDRLVAPIDDSVIIERHGPEIHKRRLANWLCRPINEPRPPRSISGPRIMLMSSNGVGLGHLTRLLAVARRLPKNADIQFLTMSQAMPIVEQAGYPVDYLPFYIYAHCNEIHWNDWLATEVGERIDLHKSDIVVYDGGQPYPGLIKAIGQRPETRFVWLRRGMWQEKQNNLAIIQRQRFFDMVIEPADIAEGYDKGSTAYHRECAVKVDPIRLLDKSELLSREEAAAALGLDPTRPACLIQLGSGTNRDLVAMIDSALAALAEHPSIQPVIGEWLISPVSLDLWPGVKRLKGFPLSRYFNAFDFSISAAGYNSYNEIMSFELPSVFIANEHASMDDQYGRARFAQDNDAAFHLPEHAHQAIGGLITPLLNPEIRKMIKQNCRKLARKNGAKAAAAAITRLHYASDRGTGRNKTLLLPKHQKWNHSRCLQVLLS